MKKLVSLVLIAALLSGLCLTASGESLSSYFTARFNKSPAFYTGPGTNYYRAGNDGYAMNNLGDCYETGKGVYRIGYFQEKYLSNMTVESGDGNVRTLHFEYKNAWITNTCQITDDPVIKNEPFATLKRGQYCQYLASFSSEYAYIELTLPNENKKARGFVPVSSLSFTQQGTITPYYPPTITNPPVIDYSTGFFTAGTWATASSQLSTYSGPGTFYTYTGTFYLQNQAVYCLAKHYDSSSRSWWVLCRISDGNAPQYLWTNVNTFYNSDWLLNRLPQD